MPYKTIVLKRGKAESLRRFHPWVFSGAIQTLPDDLREGEIVRVEDVSSQFLAVGHYQIGSIAIRILSFEDVVVDDAFWDERISEALMLRRALNLLRGDNNIFRLVHGEGDRLPGLIVDIYGETAVMQAHSVGMHYARHQIAQSLQRILGKSVTQVYYKSETTLPYKANLEELFAPPPPGRNFFERAVQHAETIYNVVDGILVGYKLVRGFKFFFKRGKQKTSKR